MEARKMLDKDIHARQRHLETSVYDLALQQLEYRAKIFAQKGIDQDSHLRNSELQSWMWTWHTLLVTRLKEEIIRIQQSPKHVDNNLAPYMALVNPEKLSLLAILEVMRLQGSGGISLGMKTTRALVSVGKSVENEYKAQMCKKYDIPMPQVGYNKGNFFSQLGYQHLRQMRLAAAASMEYGDVWSASWSQPTRSQIGGVLVECLMDVAEVTRMKVDPETGKLLYVIFIFFSSLANFAQSTFRTENQPAFFHAYEYVRGTKLGVIKLNPMVAERMAEDSLRRVIHPRHLPMLVKPKPWLRYNDGGYIYNKSGLPIFFLSSNAQLYQVMQCASKTQLNKKSIFVKPRMPDRLNSSTRALIF